ncbi:TPA: hypothetical protein JBA93_02225 [Legionella pneumophila subsp. pneumophila]|nr:hypothetical protein [Legionella pneumophila subsp. pneumophila]
MKKYLLFILAGSLFRFTAAQASVNVDAMSQCMKPCNGDKKCLDNCVSNRGIAKDLAQCLIGCGKGIANQTGETSNMDDLKACLRGCVNEWH